MKNSKKLLTVIAFIGFAASPVLAGGCKNGTCGMRRPVATQQTRKPATQRPVAKQGGCQNGTCGVRRPVATQTRKPVAVEQTERQPDMRLRNFMNGTKK